MTTPEVSAEEIQCAADILKSGGLVAFPTETVYGLGADAGNAAAVARVFQVKGRPPNHPLIVHLAGIGQLSDWASDVPEEAWALARAFWPGPLTLVLRRAPRASDAVTGGQDTVGLRVPSHPVAQQLLLAFGGGIAAPSANRFGHISPTLAGHVREEIGGEVDLILDGGPSEVGIESTIVDLSRGVPVILRPGQISATDIERVLHQPVAGATDEAAPGADGVSDARGARSGPPIGQSRGTGARGHAPRAPGSHASHYAPRAAMKVLARREFTDELARHRGQRVAVLALEISVPRVAAAVTRLLPASAALYARELYAKLHELDALGADLILVEAPPKAPAWTAIWDRLTRASHLHATGARAERHSHPWKTARSGADAAGENASPADGGGTATAAAEAGGISTGTPAEQGRTVVPPDTPAEGSGA
jgi:L-threonylcarbamoyladenylate synthase